MMRKILLPVLILAGVNLFLSTFLSDFLVIKLYRFFSMKNYVLSDLFFWESSFFMILGSLSYLYRLREKHPHTLSITFFSIGGILFFLCVLFAL